MLSLSLLFNFVSVDTATTSQDQKALATFQTTTTQYTVRKCKNFPYFIKQKLNRQRVVLYDATIVKPIQTNALSP